MADNKEALNEEAAAFDKRIRERLEAGFIPDLRRAVKCDYFYKSFWRDPHFIRLYLGCTTEILLGLLSSHCGKGLRILDVGCGAGYMSLELARNGYHVRAVDISHACIDAARKVLDENPFKEGFGSLEYEVASFEQAEGAYDILLFTGSLHHMDHMEQVIAKARSMLSPGGHLVCLEPWHEIFRPQDAAQVALIRGLLAITGFWYEGDEVKPLLSDENRLLSYIHDIHVEYVMERDKSEPGGQSPHDLSSSGQNIIAALDRFFERKEVRPGASFIYRLLGGMRGPAEVLRQLADFLACYDRLCVQQGFMRSNFFYYVGMKSGE